jgi:hypothetical protein
MTTNRLPLENVAAARRIARRDCRSCPQFQDQGDGLAYGWCLAHAQFVKLYHPPGQFWSQCQFKVLGRVRRSAEQVLSVASDDLVAD